MRLCRSLQDHFVTSLYVQCTSAIQATLPIRVAKRKSQAWLARVPRVTPKEPSATLSVPRVGLKDPRLALRRATLGSFFIGTWLFFTGAWDSVEPGMALFHRRFGLFRARVGLFGRRSAFLGWSDPLQRPDQGRSRWPPAFTRGETRFSPTPQCFFDLQTRRRFGLAGTLRCAAGQAGRLC